MSLKNRSRSQQPALSDRTFAEDASEAFSLFTDLTLTLENRVILDRQSLSVSPGEVTVLMGPSGVGKSILADVTFALSGRAADISIEGEVGTASDVGALVFQEGGGLPHLTVGNNLGLVSSDRARINELAQQFQVRLGQVVSTLSGGERRRIAFVRSVLADRRLLWLDEPEAGLDRKRVQQLGAMIADQAHIARMAIIVSTHNVNFAKDIADRILFFGTNGHLVCIFPDVKLDGVDQRLEELLSKSVTDADAEPMRSAEVHLPIPKAPGRRGSRALVNCLTQMSESIPFLPFFLWQECARPTMLRSFGLSWLRGVAYYPFIGFIFGLVFVMTFNIISANFVVSAPKIILEFGPKIVLRFAPPISAILIASAAGSTIASWIGQMSAERHFDSLEVLGVRTRRWILGPAWWGLFTASVMHALAFVIAIISVFVAYVWIERGGSFVEQYSVFLLRLESDEQFPIALSKILGYGIIVASVVTGCSSTDLRTPADVSAAITRSIVWCSITVMTIELAAVSIALAQSSFLN